MYHEHLNACCLSCNSISSLFSQAMTDIMYQRPRYDFTKEYFIRTYQAECACLRLKNALLTDVCSFISSFINLFSDSCCKPMVSAKMGLPLRRNVLCDRLLTYPRITSKIRFFSIACSVKLLLLIPSS